MSFNCSSHRFPLSSGLAGPAIRVYGVVRLSPLDRLGQTTDPDLADMPFVMLTAKTSQQDKFSGLVLAEANAYLTKPAVPARLVATVQALLSQRPRG